MDQDQKRLEEWKERYASYRQYRAQHMTIITIAITSWVLGMGFAMQPGVTWYLRVLACFLVTLIMILLNVGHVVLRKSIRRLGERIKELETQLGFEEFDTTRPLEAALLLTHVGAGIGLATTIVVLVLSVLRLI